MRIGEISIHARNAISRSDSHALINHGLTLYVFYVLVLNIPYFPSARSKAKFFKVVGQ